MLWEELENGFKAKMSPEGRFNIFPIIWYHLWGLRAFRRWALARGNRLEDWASHDYEPSLVLPSLPTSRSLISDVDGLNPTPTSTTELFPQVFPIMMHQIPLKP